MSSLPAKDGSNAVPSNETAIELVNAKSEVVEIVDDGGAAAADEEINVGDFVRVKLDRRSFVLVYIGLMLGLFLSSLDQTIVTTALKAIVEDLGDQPLIPWLGSAYLLTAAPVQTLYGKFADIFGRKWVFVFAISVFEIGSLICGAATSMAMLIAGRAIAGIGGGGIFSCVIIIISDIVSIRDRGKYQGAFGAVFGLASVVAPLAGGLFVDHATWRWCFYLNLPLGAITLYTIIFMFPKDAVEGTFRDKIGRVDFLGGLAVCAATVALITPLQLGGSTWEWNSAPVYAMFVAAAVLAAVFVYIELKIAKEPIVPASLFINSSVVVLLIIGVLMGAVFFGGFYFVTLYFQIVFGQSATQAGLSLVPLVIGLIFTSIGSGLFVSRYGKYKLFFFIGPVLLSGGIGLMSSLDASSVEWMRFIYLMVFGMAMGSMMQMRIIALQSSVPRELIAVGTAVAQTAQSLGSALGVAIIGTLFNNFIVTNTANDLELNTFITELDKTVHQNFKVSDVLPVYQALQQALSNTTLPLAYQQVVSKASQQLLDGFIATYRTSYYCLFPFPILIFCLAFFIKQFDLGGKKDGKSAPPPLAE